MELDGYVFQAWKVRLWKKKGKDSKEENLFSIDNFMQITFFPLRYTLLSFFFPLSLSLREKLTLVSFFPSRKKQHHFESFPPTGWGLIPNEEMNSQRILELLPHRVLILFLIHWTVQVLACSSCLHQELDPLFVNWSSRIPMENSFLW